MGGPGGWGITSAQGHSDYHMDAFDKTPQLGTYRHREAYVEDPQAKGYMLVNLWRPVLPMESPLGNQSQLAFLDPSSVDKDDMIKMTMFGFVDWGQTLLALKSNPKHRWYYYPHMTTDEVLVFKQVHFVKEQEEGK